MLRRRLAMPFCAVVLVLAIGAPAVQAAFPGANGKIAFESSHDTPCAPSDPACVFRYDLFSINPGGTDLNRLTNSAGDEGGTDPAWSADGNQLRFRSTRNSTPGVYSMNPDGTGVTLVKEGLPATNANPFAWSPDGQQLAFTKTDFDVNPGFGEDIYLWSLQSGAQTNLTASPFNDQYAAWSPNGDRIAFVSHRDNRVDIWTMTPSGGGLTNLTATSLPSGSSFPEWSPEGERIAFINQGLYVMNGDGRGVTQVVGSTPDAQPLSPPAWSPDGTKIAFRTLDGFCFRCSNDALRVVSLETSQVTTIFTATGASLLNLDWQPHAQPGPQRGDYRNASAFCKALRAYLGPQEFSAPYRNHGACVSANR